MADEKGPFYQFQDGKLKLHPRCEGCHRLHFTADQGEIVCRLPRCPHLDEIVKKEETENV